MSSSMFDKARKAAADTLTEDIKMLDIDNLLESPDNIFELSRIEELAETIQGQGGVKENLIVRPINGTEYEIISGHRRVHAVRHLLENGANISRYLPCLVQEYDNEEEKKLDIVLMNVSARILTDSQLFKCYEIINNMLQKRKQLGERFGKVQNKLAEILGVSAGQVATMQTIEKRAIPEVREAVESGDISINTAKHISNLDADEQKELAKKSLAGTKPKDVPKTSKKDNNVATDDVEYDGLPESSDVVTSDEVDENDDVVNSEVDTELEEIPHYKDWGVFAKTAELGLTYYKYDLPDGSKLFVMEYMQKNYFPAKGDDEWEIGTRKYIQKYEHFMPDEVSDYEVENHLTENKLTGGFTK